MPIVEFFNDKKKEQFDAALHVLRQNLSPEIAQGYLSTLRGLYQEPRQQQYQQTDRWLPEWDPASLKKEHAAQEEFATKAVEDVQKKSPEFTLPAYKALEEFRECVASTRYNAFLCVTAFIVTLAAIVMPLANSQSPKKE